MIAVFFSFLTQLVLSMVSSNDSEVKYQKKSYTYLALSANFFGNTFVFFPNGEYLGLHFRIAHSIIKKIMIKV